MSLVNLYIYQIDEQPISFQQEIDCKLGSAVRRSGEVVEGIPVPQGKIWLFPLGGNFATIERVFPNGLRIIRKVNI